MSHRAVGSLLVGYILICSLLLVLLFGCAGCAASPFGLDRYGTRDECCGHTHCRHDRDHYRRAYPYTNNSVCHEKAR